MGVAFSRNDEDDELNDNNDANTWTSNDLNSELEEEIEEESMDLALLPGKILYRIVEKMNYQDFAILDETSRVGHAICSKDGYLLPHKVQYVIVNEETTKVIHDYQTESVYYFNDVVQSPVRIIAENLVIEGQVSSGQIQAFCKLFEENRTHAEMIKISEKVELKPVDLDRLIKSTTPFNLGCCPFMAREFFQYPSIQNIQSLCLTKTGCTDDEFVKLKANELLQMINDEITAKGFNRFLKQWKNKEREVGLVYISFETSIGTRDFGEILEGLDANPVWTPTWHKDSIVGAIPLEQFSPMLSGDPEHIYSLWRPDDPENNIFIRLRNGAIEIVDRPGDEVNDVTANLTIDQHYFVMERCYYCGKQFCDHRRRFSTGRFRKKLPLVYQFLMNGIQILSIVTASVLLVECLAWKHEFNVFALKNLQVDNEVV